jgi:hypothetical protein
MVASRALGSSIHDVDSPGRRCIGKSSPTLLAPFVARRSQRAFVSASTVMRWSTSRVSARPKELRPSSGTSSLAVRPRAFATRVWYNISPETGKRSRRQQPRFESPVMASSSSTDSARRAITSESPSEPSPFANGPATCRAPSTPRPARLATASGEAENLADPRTR